MTTPKINAKDCEYVVGVCEGERTSLVNKPSNVASYLLDKAGKNFVLRSPDKQVIFSSFGPYIDACNDMYYMRAVIKQLEPMQLGLTKAPVVQEYVPTHNRSR